MTLNNSQDAIIEHRRELVSMLVLRKMPQRAIAEQLSKMDPPCINPDTNAPWSPATINLDIKALKIDWRKSYRTKIDDHVARQYAELEEVKRAAWADGDFDAVRRALETEMKLLGTAKEKWDITSDGKPLAPIITITGVPAREHPPTRD
jgi:hypothetical protein